MENLFKIESLASRTARALSELSLNAEPGAYLGAENDLLQRFEVSRPTLRQAARMVERDRLISIRRGATGGYFAERPDSRDAIRTLVQFLRLQGATLDNVIQVTRFVSEEAAAAAARCRTGDDMTLLREFIAETDSCRTAAEFIRAEARLSRMIATMSGNPAASLFLEIGYSFGLHEKGSNLYATRERRIRGRLTQRNLCNAILEGDSEVARLMMRRRYRQIREWLDLGGAAPEAGGDAQ